MAYHYTESGLRSVYIQNGYTVRETPYGETVAIEDVAGLHRVIGIALARKSHLTGAELRFLRKELGLSQRTLGTLIGSSEQNVSLWERRGRIPKAADRLVRLVYLEKMQGNVAVEKMLQDVADLDEKITERLDLLSAEGHWQEAA